MSVAKTSHFNTWVIKYRYALAMVLVLALAAFMRFYHLHSLPPGLHPDEAANGLDIIGIIEHHNFQPFYPTNGGREGLFFIIQSFFVWMIGYTTYALRVAPALISTIAVGVVYLWGSSWFGKRVGLIAAAIIATLPWSVVIGRDGFRAGMVALLVPLTLLLYTKAVRSGAIGWFIGAGVSLGAGFYTYIAFRLFPLAILVALFYLAIWQREQLMKWRRGLVISLIAAAVTLVPMGIYGLHHPADLLSRSGGVSFTNPGLNHGHPLQTLGSTAVKTALMFNFKGDDNYRQNLGGEPELNLFTGVMFVLGIFLCFTRLKSLRYFGLLVVFGTMLLPEILTAEGIPHALRAIGAMPATVVLAAIGIDYMLVTWHSVFPLNSAARLSGSLAVIVLLALSAYQGYVEYFVAWANAPDTYAAYAEDATQLAAYFNSHPFKGRRYAVGNYSLQPVKYLTHNRTSYIQIDPEKLSQLQTPPPGVALQFSVQEGDKAQALSVLRAKFPKGQVSPHYSSFTGNELFILYTVPAS